MKRTLSFFLGLFLALSSVSAQIVTSGGKPLVSGNHPVITTPGSGGSAVAFVSFLTPWGGVASAPSGSFTPSATNTILVYGSDGASSSATISFTGTGTYNVLTPPGQFPDSDNDTHTIGYNGSATAGAQIVTVTTTTGGGLYAYGAVYTHATTVTGAALYTLAPSGGTVLGTPVTVPTNSILFAICESVTGGTPTITNVGGTSRGAGANTGGPFGPLQYGTAEYAGAGSSVTPTFTTTDITTNYIVVQWLLSP